MSASPHIVRVLAIRNNDDAERELRRIGADPAGCLIMALKMRTRCIHLSNLQCRQANILKQEMLSLGGDAAVARGAVACSINQTDVILIGTDRQLDQLCCRLPAQPFGLGALADCLKNTLHHVRRTPATWKTSRRELQLTRPLVMGILNVTPDSFSDGGRFHDVERAMEHAFQMAQEGADIIDIGGESTRPGAGTVTATEELKRIIPVIEKVAGELSCAISVDTWKSAVACEALAAGAEIINDISGCTFDPHMAAVASRNGAGVVLMHTRGCPADMQQDTNYQDLTGEVFHSLSTSAGIAQAAGVAPECIALDPGIGFGKDAAGNLELIRRLSEFTCLGYPVLVGSSRKSFIGKVLGRNSDERLFGTAATVALAIAHGASIVRVHDVKAMRDVADMASFVMSAEG